METRKLLRTIHVPQGTVREVMDALDTLNLGVDVTLVENSEGHTVKRLNVYEQKLSDGSKAYTIELRFLN
jgi:hypothetical protein